MAKYRTIGSVLKDKDFDNVGTRGHKRSYIKLKEDVQLKAGSFINLVNPRTLAKDLEGKVSDEVLAKIAERGEKTPGFVLFELQVANDQE